MEKKPDRRIRRTKAQLRHGLAQLMAQNQVDPDEIQAVVGAKGYYPADTPIHVYDPGFIQGVLVGAWSSVFDAVVKNRDVPF